MVTAPGPTARDCCVGTDDGQSYSDDSMYCILWQCIGMCANNDGVNCFHTSVLVECLLYWVHSYIWLLNLDKKHNFVLLVCMNHMNFMCPTIINFFGVITKRDNVCVLCVL